MNSQKYVLILENRQDWQNQLKKILEKAGYTVFATDNKETAAKILNDELIHVASLDIDLEDSPTKKSLDRSGYDLGDELQKLQLSPSALRVVIVSGHEGYTRYAFRDLQISDFLPKRSFKTQAYIKAIDKAFNELQLNPDLLISWRQGEHMEELIVGKKFLGITISVSEEHGSLREKYTIVIKDLLRRLFYEDKSILLTPFSGGFSNALVAQVDPLRQIGGAASSVVVKIDEFDEIKAEYKNYKNHVGDTINFSTQIVSYRRAATMGGIAYSFVGQHGKQLINFADYFQQKNADMVIQVINSIFNETCELWYSQLQIEHLNITEIYGETCHITYEKLKEKRMELLGIKGEVSWAFEDLSDKSREFTSVMPVFENETAFSEQTYKCVTHGDLNAQNILIDDRGSAWLIDFRMTGESHVLRDLTFLDSIIRIQLTDATLDERLLLDETLLSASEYSDLDNLPESLDTQNESLEKAYKVAIALRRIAENRMQALTRDMRDYYLGLFFTGFNQIRYEDLTKEMREHAALQACLIQNKLGL